FVADVPRALRVPRRREELRELLSRRAEPAGGQHDGTRTELVRADCGADDRVVLHDQPVDAQAKRDVDADGDGGAVQSVNQGLAAAVHGVRARLPLLTAEDQTVVKRDTVGSEPV